MSARTLCLGAVALVWLACAPPPNIDSFTASRTEVRSKQETVTLSWSVRDATKVTLTGAGEVAGTGSLDVHPSRTTIYELVATSPAGRVSDRVEVAAVKTPLAGRAVHLSGRDVAAARVFIDGKETGQTDAMGAFAGSVLPPYQLTVFDESTAQVVHYRALTSPAPTATVFGGSGGTSVSSAIRGRLEGTSLDTSYRVVWISRGRELDGAVAADGTFQVPVSLQPGQSATGDLVALRYDPPTSPLPLNYLAGGRVAQVTITAGSDTTGVVVPVSPPIVEPVVVNVEPGTLTPLLLAVVLDFGESNQLTLGMRPASAGAVTVFVPRVAGGTPAAMGFFQDGAGGRFTAYAPATGGSASIVGREAPQLVSPAQGSTINPAGSLRWAGGTGLCRVSVSAQSPSGLAAEAIGFTEVPISALLPTAVGMGQGTYSWRVQCLDRFTAVDDAIAGVWPSGVTSDVAESARGSFTFTP